MNKNGTSYVWVKFIKYDDSINEIINIESCDTNFTKKYIPDTIIKINDNIVIVPPKNVLFIVSPCSLNVK